MQKNKISTEEPDKKDASVQPGSVKTNEKNCYFKSPSLLYGIAFGLMIGLLIGHYSKNLWLYTVIGGIIGFLAGSLSYLLKKKK